MPRESCQPACTPYPGETQESQPLGHSGSYSASSNASPPRIRTTPLATGLQVMHKEGTRRALPFPGNPSLRDSYLAVILRDPQKTTLPPRKHRLRQGPLPRNCTAPVVTSLQNVRWKGPHRTLSYRYQRLSNTVTVLLDPQHLISSPRTQCLTRPQVPASREVRICAGTRMPADLQVART